MQRETEVKAEERRDRGREAERKRGREVGMKVCRLKEKQR